MVMGFTVNGCCPLLVILCAMFGAVHRLSPYSEVVLILSRAYRKSKMTWLTTGISCILTLWRRLSRCQHISLCSIWTVLRVQVLGLDPQSLSVEQTSCPQTAMIKLTWHTTGRKLSCTFRIPICTKTSLITSIERPSSKSGWKITSKKEGESTL